MSATQAGLTPSTAGDVTADVKSLTIISLANGATLVSDSNNAPAGFAIPSGSSGASTQMIVYAVTRADQIAALAGRIIQITVKYNATTGFYAASTFYADAVVTSRPGGSAAGTTLALAQSGTVLTKTVSYTVTGSETAIGVLLQLSSASAAQTTAMQVTLASVAWSVISSPLAAGAAGETTVAAIRANAAARFAVPLLDEIGDSFGNLGAGVSWLRDTKTNNITGWSIPPSTLGGNTYLQVISPFAPEDWPLYQSAVIRVTVLLTTSANYGRVISPTVFWNSLWTSGGGGLSNENVLFNGPISSTAWKIVVEGGVDATAQRIVTVLQNGVNTNGVISGDITTSTTDTIQVSDLFVEVIAAPAGVVSTADCNTRLLANKAARRSKRALMLDYTLHGTVYSVAPSGGNATSIYAAMQVVTPGTKITVSPGVYTETQVYPLVPELQIEGIGNGPALIQYAQANSTALASITSNSASDWHKTVTVRRLRITAQNARYAAHLDSANTDRQTIMLFEDCHLEHLGNAGAVSYQTGLGGSGNPSGVWINCAAMGIGLSDGARLEVRNCRLFGYNFDAIHAHNWGTASGGQNLNGVRLRVEHCVLDPQANGTTSTNINAFYYANIGSGTCDQVELIGNLLNGPVQCGSAPWIDTTASRIPANKMLFSFTGHSNTPAPYILDDDGSRALMITSATTGTSSSVTVSGSAVPVLFGASSLITTIAGAVGRSGAVYGWLDIGDHLIGVNADQNVTPMGVRLGNCTTNTLSLVITVDGGSPVTVTFNANYTSSSTATILGMINTALGSAATASAYNVNDLFRPRMLDEELRIRNTDTTTIKRKTAVAFNGTHNVGRVMTSADPLSAFAGIAYEDIVPGAWGRVKSAGAVRVANDMIRSDSGSFTAGATFGVGATAGQFVASPVVPLLTAINASDVQFGLAAEALVEAAWTTYTPSIVAGSGTFTTASAIGRYKKMGRQVTVELSLSITTNGTAASYIQLGLPFASASAAYNIGGRELSNTGKWVVGQITAGSNAVNLTYYDNTYPGGNGNTITVTGIYESAA